jgi:putative SOS response-associated peptidase YedK
MCGRYAITLPPEAVRAFFDYIDQPNFPPRYNIAPTQPIPIVVAEPRSEGRRRRFLLARWGFLPGFVRDPKAFPLLINARAETLADKASFRPALKRRRCLVIADGFYEWRRMAADKASPKRPYLIRPAGGGPMGLAGLFETWSEPGGGEIDTACIITTTANRLMAEVHERMPAIIPHGAFSAWLDTDGVTAEEAVDLLRPAPEPSLELIEIGPAVNRVANDNESVQTAIAPPIRFSEPD